MPEVAKPVYLVDAYSDPVVIRVEGRAAFQNSSSLNDFLRECMRQGKTRFVVDFQNCQSMDSTFLGVLAGAGLQLRKLSPPGSLVLARLGQRNMELVRNLGLHYLTTVDCSEMPAGLGMNCAPLSDKARSELEHAKLALEAHENLIATDASNRSKFQDVLAFLKNRVEQK